MALLNAMGSAKVHVHVLYNTI